jgi:acyl carrier protein
VGRDDNFFEIGGHSLLAMQVVALIEERTGFRPEPRSLFFMTLGELADSIDSPVTTA